MLLCAVITVYLPIALWFVKKRSNLLFVRVFRYKDLSLVHDYTLIRKIMSPISKPKHHSKEFSGIKVHNRGQPCVFLLPEMMLTCPFDEQRLGNS